METSSSLRTSPATIALISAGTVLLGTFAYAAYFDHRRRSDPAFRKALKREHKALVKQQKHAAESAAKEQQKTVRGLVEKMNEAGYPSDAEEQEAFFLKHLAMAEKLQSCMFHCYWT
jgi:mitochondrial import receptor subunit TOM20